MGTGIPVNADADSNEASPTTAGWGSTACANACARSGDGLKIVSGAGQDGDPGDCPGGWMTPLVAARQTLEHNVGKENLSFRVVAAD